MQRKGHTICSRCGSFYPDSVPPCRNCPAKPVANNPDAEQWPCGNCSTPVDRPNAVCCYDCVRNLRMDKTSCEVPQHKGDKLTPRYMVRQGEWLTTVRKEKRIGNACDACIGSGIATVTSKATELPVIIEPQRQELQVWQCVGYLGGTCYRHGKKTYDYIRGRQKFDRALNVSGEWTHARVSFTDGNGFPGALAVPYSLMYTSGIDPDEVSGHDGGTETEPLCFQSHVLFFGNGVKLFYVSFETREAMLDDAPYVQFKPHGLDIPAKYKGFLE